MLGPRSGPARARLGRSSAGRSSLRTSAQAPTACLVPVGHCCPAVGLAASRAVHCLCQLRPESARLFLGLATLLIGLRQLLPQLLLPPVRRVELRPAELPRMLWQPTCFLRWSGLGWLGSGSAGRELAPTAGSSASPAWIAARPSVPCPGRLSAFEQLAVLVLDLL